MRSRSEMMGKLLRARVGRCSDLVLRGRGNPVLLGGSLFASVASLTGDEGARGLLRARDGVIEIAVDDESVLMDIDTREDLTRALGGA